MASRPGLDRRLFVPAPDPFAGALLVEVRPNGALGRIDAGWCELVGLAPAEIGSRRFADLFAPDDQAAITRAVERIRVTPVCSFEARCQRGAVEGERVEVTLFSGGGESFYAVARTHAVPERRAVARLLRQIAHDMNNHLAVVLGATSTLRDDTEVDSESYADLDEATEAAERCARLTGALAQLALG